VNLSELRELPPTLDAQKVAELLNISYWTLLQQVRRGAAPVEPLNLGRYKRFRTVDVLRVLGIDPAWILGPVTLPAPNDGELGALGRPD
jgi:hypothetical protein